MRPDRTGQEPYWEEDYRTAEYDRWRIECDALDEHAGSDPHLCAPKALVTLRIVNE